METSVEIGSITIGKGSSLALIAGPCVIETPDVTFEIARTIKEIASKLEIPFIFKASFDKANRTSIYKIKAIRSAL